VFLLLDHFLLGRGRLFLLLYPGVVGALCVGSWVVRVEGLALMGAAGDIVGHTRVLGGGLVGVVRAVCLVEPLGILLAWSWGEHTLLLQFDFV